MLWRSKSAIVNRPPYSSENRTISLAISPRYSASLPCSANSRYVRARSGFRRISPASSGRPCGAYTAADVGNVCNMGFALAAATCPCVTGTPSSHNSMAGSRQVMRSRMPYRSCARRAGRRQSPAPMRQGPRHAACRHGINRGLLRAARRRCHWPLPTAGLPSYTP